MQYPRLSILHPSSSILHSPSEGSLYLTLHSPTCTVHRPQPQPSAAKPASSTSTVTLASALTLASSLTL
eukprot:CAMPEP_0174753708 /NCGR_PEP_ID=MMETSP1094-20130205/104574_1 /TAXON_ID=156173 /ORGANISM="Chrysochromulina brevifilum, Strain UTEX LB 985" /LENGTH=68 /DNA_ID=CAMNT_0015959517 /DNA_START=106 /DNA_END=309 /DNA_ORIENTATION=+